MPEPFLNEIVDVEEYGRVLASFSCGNDTIEDYFPYEHQYSGESIYHPPFSLPHEKIFYNKTALANQREHVHSSMLWNEIATAVTQPDLLITEENHIQESIFQLKRSISIRHRSNLANKLLTLFNDAKEEDPCSIGISSKSLQNFINFIHLNSNLKCPTISLTPEYNIYASWRSKQKQLFGVHFLPNDDARFVIFKPNNRHPERIIRISGIVSIDTLMETTMHYHINEWISE